MVSYAIDWCGVDGGRDRVRRGGRRIAQRPLIGGLAADRVGAKRMIVFGLMLQRP
ncbi:MAG: hypothetical protein WA709_37000 [Stellaceae bacterium]